jgi:hypothetical protein
LGDLTNGSNGDPRLTQFGKRITPNYHRLATNFVTLDNFMHPGDGSMDGWSWAMQGRVTNTETITQQLNYAFVNRGLSYESEGMNRNVAVNFPTVAGRDSTSGGVGQYPCCRRALLEALPTCWRAPVTTRLPTRRSAFRKATSSMRCCRPAARCGTTAFW